MNEEKKEAMSKKYKGVVEKLEENDGITHRVSFSPYSSHKDTKIRRFKTEKGAKKHAEKIENKLNRPRNFGAEIMRGLGY